MIFSSLLTGKNFEDDFVLKNTNKVFKKKANIPFKIPKEKKPAILLVSGGMDSVFLWYILLKKYKLNVYPLHLKRVKILDPQIAAIKYFSHLFKKLFPELFHEPKFLKSPESLFSFKNNRYSKVFDKNLIIQNVSLNKKTGNAKVIMTSNPSRLGIYLYSAFNYSLYLKSHGIPVFAFFAGITPDDTFITRESTLTVLRGINMTICSILGDWRYQILAPVDKKNRFYYTKKQLLKFCFKDDFPIFKTWSCDKTSPFHCGRCVSCKLRKLAFYEAKIKDQTVYLFSKRSETGT